MKLLSVSLEKLAIRTILAGSRNEVATRLLGTLSLEHFRYPPATEAFSRVKGVLATDGQLPSWVELINDPALDQKNRDIWSDYSKKPLKSTTQGRRLVKRLEEYRLVRQVYYRSKQNINILREDKINVDQLIADNRVAFTQEQLIIDQDEVFRHFGAISNSSGLLDRLKSGDMTPLIPTGIEAFDNTNVGVAVGSLFMIASTTGGGKTAVAMQIGINMARQGARVCHINLEMSKDELECRLFANLAKVRHDKFLKPKDRMGPEDYTQIEKAERRFNRQLKKLNALYSVMVPVTDPYLEDMFMMLAPFKYDVYIVDMINLFKGMGGESQWQRLSEGARFAKRFASTNNCIVIMLCQLGSAGEVRYSRALVEHSTLFWTWITTEESKKQQELKVQILKARNQQTFNFKIKTDFARMRFTSESIRADEEEIADEEAEDMADYYAN